MIILEVTVIAAGGEVQGRIGSPQPLRSSNADSSGPSSNQMSASSTAPQPDSATSASGTCQSHCFHSRVHCTRMLTSEVLDFESS